MGISFKSIGTWKRTKEWLDKVRRQERYRQVLDSYGRKGVQALASATPTRSGLTARSWDYTIETRNGGATIIWTNSNVNKGFPVAIMLQYGHGTGTGGYVVGYDYINPAIRPIFDSIAEDLWKLVKEG